MDTRTFLPEHHDDQAVLARKGKRRFGPWIAACVAVIVIAVLLWRAPWNRPVGGPGMPGKEALESVEVAVAGKGDIPIRITALGTVTSLATVTVKSQISGYLTEIHFREGQMVRKGDLLAQIDPRPYEAALAQYEGTLEKDRALLENARIDLERYRRLNAQDSISRQTVDTAAATVRQYEGAVRADQALVDAQKLNLIYCRIVSPVEGRVGLRQIDVGNYVTASDTNGLVVVTQIDPISVVFTLAEDDIARVLPRLRSGARLQVDAYDRANAVKLADGLLDTIDNQIDTTTGTVKLRALFANPDGALFPNQFVNARLHVNTLVDVVLVPAAAVQSGIPGAYAYLVNADDTVSLRTVRVGASANRQTAVLEGLAAGDRVVIDGADRLRDGVSVRIAGRPVGARSPATVERPSGRAQP